MDAAIRYGVGQHAGHRTLTSYAGLTASHLRPQCRTLATKHDETIFFSHDLIRIAPLRRAWTVPGRTTRMRPPRAAENGAGTPPV